MMCYCLLKFCYNESSCYYKRKVLKIYFKIKTKLIKSSNRVNKRLEYIPVGKIIKKIIFVLKIYYIKVRISFYYIFN